jgi:hypothetical protein
MSWKINPIGNLFFYDNSYVHTQKLGVMFMGFLAVLEYQCTQDPAVARYGNEVCVSCVCL